MVVRAPAGQAVSAAGARTIVLRTDGNPVLLGNHDDGSDPRTRIGFISGDEAPRGCVDVGFGNLGSRQ